MDRIRSIFVVILMGIFMVLFNIFWSSDQFVFVLISALGILSSLGLLFWSNRHILKKFKK